MPSTCKKCNTTTEIDTLRSMRTKIGSMKVVELKEALRKLSAPCSGLKVLLQIRLTEAVNKRILEMERSMKSAAAPACILSKCNTCKEWRVCRKCRTLASREKARIWAREHKDPRVVVTAVAVVTDAVVVTDLIDL